MIKFPLPAGHRFGYNPNDISVHDGTESATDAHNLWLWQRQLSLGDPDFNPSRQFDGPTQRAVINIQTAHGLTVTAELDEPTWNVALNPPGSPAEARVAPPKVVVKGKSAKRPKAPLAAWTPGFGT